jgi:hypothetical protein
MVATKQIKVLSRVKSLFKENNRNYFYNNEIKSRKNVVTYRELSLNVNKIFFHNESRLDLKILEPCTYKCIKISIFMTDHIVLSK